MARSTLIPRISGVDPRSLGAAAIPAYLRWLGSWNSISSVAVCFLLAPSLALAQLVSPEMRISTFGSDTYQNVQSEPSVVAIGTNVLAAWQNDLQVAGGIGWGYSLDAGLSWIDGHELPSTWGDVPLAQPTVCGDRAGNFFVAAITGTSSGESVSFWRGSFQGPGFTWQFGAVLVPIIFNVGDPPYDRPWLGCDPDRGYLYLTYTRVERVETGNSYYPHHMMIYLMRSLDHGVTWSAPVAISGTACNGSHPAVGPDGELYVVWEDFGVQQVLGRKSTDFGVSFGPAFAVAPILDNLSTPPSGWRVPWFRFNPLYPPLNSQAGPDFPAIAIDRGSGPRRGTIYAAWADYAGGTVGPATGTVADPEPNDYFGIAAPFTLGQDLRGFARSADFGGPDCDDYTFEATAGTTIWMSGEVLSASPGNYDGSPVVMYFWLYCAGDLTRPLEVVPFLPGWAGTLPPLIFTLPSSGRYYVAMTCPGYSSYSYRLKTRALNVLPGQAARDFRDIVLASSSDGGTTWSAKRRVNDDPAQFDNALPSLAVDGLGQVHVAWYDRRDDSACGEYVHTYWTESLDGGVTFLPAQRLSGQAGSWQFHGSSDATNIGDHLGLAASGDRAYALWTDSRGMPGDLADIYAVSIQTDIPTAVAVSGFRAEEEGAGISLRWWVGDPSGLSGFRLYRSSGGEGYDLLDPALVTAHGIGEYRMEDATATPGQRYRYRLEIVAVDGTRRWLGPVEGQLSSSIDRLAWEDARPNPFSSSIQFTLAVPRGGAGTVRVYDLLGHEVATLERGPLSAGRQRLTWDGRDRAGHRAPPGVYLLRAEQGREARMRRIIRIQ